MINHTKLPRIILALFLGVSIFGCAKDADNPIEKDALARIATLEQLMDEARGRSIDVKREESLLWFSNEFLKFADWDEVNRDMVEAAFGYYVPYADEKARYADELPDFERQEVVAMLDAGIADLKAVLSGDVVRPPVNAIDWQNIVVGDDVLISNGKPVFLFDYFSMAEKTWTPLIRTGP